MTKTLPSVTPDECAQHPNGTSRNHTAHTIRVAVAGGPRGYHYVPVARCPGRHTAVTLAPPADPFAGIAAAYGDEPDRDL